MNESWVFPNFRKSSFINYNNFRRRAWKECVAKIIPGVTPYNCRDTFISRQLAANIPPAYIAKWCDTSISMIEKFYFAIDDSYSPV
ncbi:MAG: hypothetical protein F6K48_28130 [Okeania sp. SIO3H1]|uniref:hypothetical protein n=1 Tax=Okeania sp. SIO1I7 TaxID=2607772 RepID=UPI0013CBB4AD|nr:hypothetical protein [Okeania sp. SIO1I7]NEN92556.1 hypothetical protein [Okeania sp. SIO3H1]NET30332.1 hypothetical protein [Okeania sp. SIO1I7]